MPLKKNQIYQGDCIKQLAKLDKGSVDLVFADPPFNIGYEYDVYDDSQSSETYLTWCREWIDGVYRALKPDGTFWLAIGDEYAAELKIESQRAGFHCRSWVIWYYTFGVNCANGFSRSHTHLFHFVKDPKNFTFNRPNPRVRVKSARQQVYADNRANPSGRLPDNTWFTRPQDLPESFGDMHDTWYFARVAGTFKEREGFHGCQMPEQLLARIILASSNGNDLVVDPFSGSGTTLCTAKKLGRRWIGFELSKDYVAFINKRIETTNVDDPIDGPDDPIESAPSTAKGKRRKKPFDKETEKIIIDSYGKAQYPADYILCDPELNSEFIERCMAKGIGGNAYVWNQLLLRLRKRGQLPPAKLKAEPFKPEEMDRFGFASEVAWRLLALDYRKTLDEIMCSPEFAAEFDRLALQFGPEDIKPIHYRRAAFSIRKRSSNARDSAAGKFSQWMNKRKTKGIERIGIDECLSQLECPGVFMLCSEESAFYIGESRNMRKRVEMALSNEKWNSLEPDSVKFVKLNSTLAEQYALKSALAVREYPLLNCRLLMHDSEFPKRPR